MRRDGQLDRPLLGLVRQEEESEFEDKLPSMLQWSVRQRSCKSRLVAWPGPAGRPPLHPALFSNPRWCRRRCRCRQAGQLLASLIDLAASTSDKASTSPAWPDHPRSLSWARRAGQSQPQPACGAVVWRAVVQRPHCGHHRLPAQPGLLQSLQAGQTARKTKLQVKVWIVV